MRSIFRILLTAILAAGITGCASDKPKDEETVSSIPWAKPESWQGQGPFGGMMQGSR